MKTFSLSAAALVLISGQAFAADLPSKQPPALFTVSPGFSWSGFYTGVNFGGIGAFGSNTYSATPTGFGTDKAQGAGLAGGFQLGYNYQIQNIVLGVEGDYAFAFGEATANSASFPATAPTYSVGGAKTTIGSLGTARGRAGFTTGSTLFYATGGVAYSYVKSTALYNQGGQFSFPGTNVSKVGWVVGGGVEQAVADHVTLKAEVLYADLGYMYGSTTPAANSFSYQTKVSAIVGRVGLNFKFGTEPAPVVAKY